MHTTTRRRIASACAALALGVTGLGATTASAEAAGPYFELGDAECSVIEMTGYGVGLATYFPRVYAADVTRGRDLQNVTVRTDAYQWNGSSWILIARGDTFTGVAAHEGRRRAGVRC